MKTHPTIEALTSFWTSGDRAPSSGFPRFPPCAFLCFFFSIFWGNGVLSDTAQTTQSLAELSLEQLLNEPVTSVSKREQKIGEVAAAISVLSNDEIRRSGATSIMDALRLVPGLNVGSVNANDWSISARGFNGLYANKLLVLIDGRAVYTPVYSGVHWDLQQTLLEDLDRIEVIRGPGATIWGSNAVNGVINVVTKSARDTQGGYVQVAGGNFHQAMAAGRYGSKLGEETYARVFGGYRSTADFALSNGADAGDGWQSGQGGFRLDHYPDPGTQLTWLTEATVADLLSHTSEAYNVHTIGRWTREFSDESSLEIQMYYDRVYRDEITRAEVGVDTLDLTLDHSLSLGERNHFIWGLGYRYNWIQLDQTNPLVQITDNETDLHLFSAFAQNEFKIIPDKLSLTAGVKLEHNEFTGVEVQPSARAVFTPSDRQTFWGAISRAVRIPSVATGQDALALIAGAPFPGPGGALFVPTLVGNPYLKSEDLLAYELGYRVQPMDRLSFDLSLFYNEYKNLASFGGGQRFVPGIPVGRAEAPFQNNLYGETYGGEVTMTLSPLDHWRLIAGYAHLISQIHGSPSGDPVGSEGSAPQHQFVLRSSYDFSSKTSADVQLRYVDNLRAVPSYITADLKISYRPIEQLEFSIVGQNLFSPRHLEQEPQFFSLQSEVVRGVYGQITWRF